MNKRFLLLVIVVGAFSVVSCGKKEGVPEKKYKIDDIVAVERQYENGVIFFTIDSYVEEDWHWDGNEVYRIDYRGDHPYSENIFYDNHRRIARTTIPAYDIATEFEYEGKLLDHIDCYRNEELICTFTFIHSEDALTEIQLNSFVIVDDSVAGCLLRRCNPLASLVGGDIAARIFADDFVNSASQRLNGAKEMMQTRYLLTWTENNVTAIQRIDSEGSHDIVLTYDDKRNPYNQLFDYRELNDPIFGFEMLSENNIKTIRMPYMHFEEQLFTYQYEYSDNFPSKRTLSYSYAGVSYTTLDSVTYSFEKTETFHYLD